MRVKGRKPPPTILLADAPADLSGLATALPYSLLPPAVGDLAAGSVLPAAAEQPQIELPPLPPPPPAASNPPLLIQSTAVAEQPQAVSASGRPARKRKAAPFLDDMIPPEALTASGRPARKRKAAFSDDMIPPDALLKRNKARLPAELAAAMRQPTAADAADARAAAAAAARAAAAGQPSFALPGMMRAGSGAPMAFAVPGLAALAATAPFAALQLAHPDLHAQYTSPPLPSAQPQAAPRIMPFALVAPPLAADPTVPPVQTATAADIVQLAKQEEDEERRQAIATAVADARVVLRVLPGPQVAQPVARTASGRVGGRGRGATAAAEKQQQAAGRGGRGRGRGGGRGSRQPTPDPAEEEEVVDLDEVCQAGVELRGGLSLVDPVKSAAALPPAPVVVGTPAKWQLQQPVRQSRAEPHVFSEDPLAASLEFLKYAARNAGRLPQYVGPVQNAVNAEHRLYKERLTRALHARGGRRASRDPRMVGTRKSARTRTAPNVYMPVLESALPRSVAGQPSPGDETDMRLGEEFQCGLPRRRPRPAAPTEEEARWLEGLVMEPGEVAAPSYDAKEVEAMPAAHPEARAAWVERARGDLAALVGTGRASALGLDAMGLVCAGLLGEAEQAGLYVGMREVGRDFSAIHREFVPTRSPLELSDFYYNVWKLRGTGMAAQWYEERLSAEETAEAARRAEATRAEREREAEVERRREQQQAGQKRRMLREAVGWLRTAARAPLEGTAVGRLVVRDRAARAAKLVGSLNA